MASGDVAEGNMAIKTVYEMAVDGDLPPPRYMVKENRFGIIDISVPTAPIPVIDLGLLSCPPPACDKELEKLKSALHTWGCFQATGHGIPISDIDRVRNIARQFFQLPVEQKKKCFRRSAKDGEGYGGDVIVSEKQVLDWSDRLVLKLLPEDERRLELWPEIPHDFRGVLHEYSMKIKAILELLFKAIAKLLNLEEDCFLKQFGERALLIGRLNFYPPCPQPNEVLGLKPHSDKSGMTVLLQDKEIEGLHVLKDNQWYKVPVIPYAFVVNVGDQMQIMTNGIIKSPIHRAVTNHEKLRISLSVSNESERDREIGPADGLITEETPRLYKNVKNFAQVNLECFQKGEVAIETIRV